MSSFKSFTRMAVVLISLFCAGWVSAADIVIGTWNIKRLGHGSQQDFHALAEVAGRFDLLALQEVMNESGLERLLSALESHTGESWSKLASHAIGSSSYKEHYAFIWKDSSVEYDEGAAVYIDFENQFIREPFSAKFRSKRDGSKLAVGTVHILFGKRVSDRTPEITALAEYWEWLAEVYPSTPLMLVGDFNLQPDHSAWVPLKRMARPLVSQGATTLSSINGRYANLYDNIWVEIDSNLPIASSGIVDFPRMLNLNHKSSRALVSDHAPVFIALGNASFDDSVSTFPPRNPALNFTYQENNVQPNSHPVLQNSSSGAIRGNRNSKFYHRSDCPSYNQISQKNRVEFNSAVEAQASGYRLAGNC